MKPELAVLCALLLVGCAPEVKGPTLSATHQWLLDFQQDYKTSWTGMPNEVTRRFVTQDYHQRLVAFITGKNYVLDSVRVKVGRIEAKGGSVFTEFKGPGILFHYVVHSQEDVVALTKGLQEGRDTVLSFTCGGPAELTRATDPYPVRIEATPHR